MISKNYSELLKENLSIAATIKYLSKIYVIYCDSAGFSGFSRILPGILNDFNNYSELKTWERIYKSIGTRIDK